MMPKTVEPPQTAPRIIKGQWNGWHAIHFCATRTATVTCCTSTGTMASGTGTSTGSTMTGMRTTFLPFSQISHFSSAFMAGEFCFVSWPFHPPSILPISSSGVDRIIYFLSSMELFSQRTMSNILSVSSFRIASLIHSCFSSLDKKLAIATASIISTNKLSIFCPSVYRCGLGRIWKYLYHVE